MSETETDRAEVDESVEVRLNASEDAVAWAVAHFGADAEIVKSMSPEARVGIRAAVDGLPEDDAARILEMEAWRERARVADRVESGADGAGVAIDGLEGRWSLRVGALLVDGPSTGAGPSLRAQLAVVDIAAADKATLEWPRDEQLDGPVGLRRFTRMEPEELLETLRDIGVWQIAAIVSGQGRRRAARVRSKIPERWSETFQAGLDENADMSAAATTRIQEVYLGLNRRGFGFVETVEQLGIFAVMAGCGGRFERRLEVWLRRAPSGVAERAVRLARLNDRPLRLRLGPVFRTSLERYWGHRQSHLNPMEPEDG